MKRGIFVLLLFVGLGAGAQVVKYATEVAALSGDEVEGSTVWDLSGRALLRDDGPGYVFVDEGIVYENFGGSCRAYAVVGDSLFFRGYNVGRAERMNVTEGEGFSLVPQDFGQVAAYSAEGLNRERLATAENGTVSFTVLGMGRIIAGTDTIRNVSLYRVEFDAVKTLGDSVMTVDNKFVVYNWTVPGSAYPVAVQYVGEGDPVLYLRPLDGEEFAAAETEDGYDEEATMRALDGASAEVTDGTVRVTFPAGAEALDVDIYLLDVQGFLYGHRTANTADDFPCVFDTAGLKHGQYIVAVHLHENPELNRRILVVL